MGSNPTPSANETAGQVGFSQGSPLASRFRFGEWIDARTTVVPLLDDITRPQWYGVVPMSTPQKVQVFSLGVPAKGTPTPEDGIG